MVELRDRVIAVGSDVVIRSVRSRRTQAVVTWLRSDDRPVQAISIVVPGDMGPHRLTPRMPLGKALLGHRAGDVVSVRVEAGTVQYEVVSVEPNAATVVGGSTDAGVAEPVDAAVLKTAPAKGAGSSPAARTNPKPDGAGDAVYGPVRVGDVVLVQEGELEEWWRIVPYFEADAQRRRISAESPLARALLGHRTGDVVHVRAPGAPRTGWPVTLLAVKSRGAA